MERISQLLKRPRQLIAFTLLSTLVFIGWYFYVVLNIAPKWPWKEGTAEFFDNSIVKPNISTILSPAENEKNRTTGFSSNSSEPRQESSVVKGLSSTTLGYSSTKSQSQAEGEPSEQNGLRALFSTPPTRGCSTASQPHVQGPQPAENFRLLPMDRRLMYSNTCQPYLPPKTSKLILNLNRQNFYFPKNRLYRKVTQVCAYNACTITDDLRLLSRADAVMVYICRQNRVTPPPRASPRQIWVAFCMESPIHYRGHHDSPKWKNVFNWTMNYRIDSDVFYPYAFLSLRSGPSLKNFTSIALRKTRPVAWFVSNCKTQSKRRHYVQQLQRYINVDIYGRCSRNKKKRNYLPLLNTTYYFYLSFENSFCRDYVTEKMFKIYGYVDTVPIVRGGADYSRYFPPDTYLNTADYGSPRQLAEHLKALMADPAGAYARLLENKDRFRVRGDTDRGHNVCELCRRLHNPGPPKMYPDIMKWVRGNSCRNPSDL